MKINVEIELHVELTIRINRSVLLPSRWKLIFIFAEIAFISSALQIAIINVNKKLAAIDSDLEY